MSKHRKKDCHINTITNKCNKGKINNLICSQHLRINSLMFRHQNQHGQINKKSNDFQKDKNRFQSNTYNVRGIHRTEHSGGEIKTTNFDNGREPERLRTEYVNVLSLPERAAEKSTSRSKQSSNQKPVVKQQSSFPPQ